MSRIDEDEALRERTELEEQLNKFFYLNDNNDLVIKGIISRLILTPDEQKQIAREIKDLKIKTLLGEKPTLMEQLFLYMITKDTH